MHRLRTCAARLRPLTASQTAHSAAQTRPAAVGTPRTFQHIRCYTAPVAAEPFLNGTSSNYVEEMYYAWLENPKSVHKVSSHATPHLQLCLLAANKARWGVEEEYIPYPYSLKCALDQAQRRLKEISHLPPAYACACSWALCTEGNLWC